MRHVPTTPGYDHVLQHSSFLCAARPGTCGASRTRGGNAPVWHGNVPQHRAVAARFNLGVRICKAMPVPSCECVAVNSALPARRCAAHALVHKTPRAPRACPTACAQVKLRQNKQLRLHLEGATATSVRYCDQCHQQHLCLSGRSSPPANDWLIKSTRVALPHPRQGIPTGRERG